MSWTTVRRYECAIDQSCPSQCANHRLNVPPGKSILSAVFLNQVKLFNEALCNLWNMSAFFFLCQEIGRLSENGASSMGFSQTMTSGTGMRLLLIVQSLKSCPTLQIHAVQHTRLPCPSLSPRVCSDSCQMSWQCCLTISSSATLFFFCLQSLPAQYLFQ